MDDYKFLQRRKLRGDHCCLAYRDEAGIIHSSLCGCGTRVEPGKKDKNRIVRRVLQRQLQDEIRGFSNADNESVGA